MTTLWEAAGLWPVPAVGPVRDAGTCRLADRLGRRGCVGVRRRCRVPAASAGGRELGPGPIVAEGPSGSRVGGSDLPPPGRVELPAGRTSGVGPAGRAGLLR